MTTPKRVKFVMPRLGIRQLEMLRGAGTTGALIVPCKTSRRLVELGMMTAEPDGSFARTTPAGLRALADAVEAGRINLFEMPKRLTGRESLK